MLVLKREYLLVCRMRKEEGDEKKTLHRMTKYFSLQRRPCLLCSHASLDLHLEGKQPQTATRSKKSRNEQEKEAVPRFSLTTGIAGGFLISKIKCIFKFNQGLDEGRSRWIDSALNGHVGTTGSWGQQK